MGGLLTKIKQALFFGQKKRILMLGLDAAGKTTILYQLIGIKLGQSVPTIGFNVEQVQYKNIQFTIWEVGGACKIWDLWHYYFAGTDALIYVVDSTDIQRMEENKIRLKGILSSQETKNIPLLLFANKQDIAQITLEQIVEQLELEQINGTRHWTIKSCSAISAVGLFEGLDWMQNVINQNNNN